MIILTAAVVISLVCYACYKWDIKQRIHIHNHCKPIVSKYVSFNYRDIVYECRCGSRKIFRVYTPYGKPFPIQTTNFLTQKELEQIANEN